MSTLFSLGGLPAHPQKPLFLEDQFVSLSLASLLRPVRLGRPYREHKVPAGIARKVIEDRKPPPHHHHDKVETIGGEFFYIIRLFQSSTCLEQTGAHHQEVSCINTTSGIVTLCKWPSGTQVEKEVPSRPAYRTATYRE